MIFPLVFFTGKGEYRGMRTIWELCGEGASQMQAILQSPFHVINVSTWPEEDLIQHVWAGTLGFLLRPQFKNHVQREIKKIAVNLNTIGLEEEGQYLIELFNYILNIENEEITIDNVVGIIHEQVSSTVENKMSSLADRLKEEGRKQGREQAMEQAKQEAMSIADRLREEAKEEEKLDTAKAMLAVGLDLAVIVKVTGLPIEAIKKFQ